MHILYLIKDFDFGGAENHVCDLANAMDELGNAIYIIARKGSQSIRLNKNIRFIPMYMADVLIPFQVVYICFFLAKHKIDIIHSHKRLAIFLGSCAGKIMNVPVVATIHGRPKYDLRSWISRKYTDKLIFVSNRTFEANIHRAWISRKSVLIHNGVKMHENVKEKDCYSICYISRIDRRHYSIISLLVKDVFPSILKDFPGVTFNMIGDGEYMLKLEKEIRELNEHESREVCKIHGYVPEVGSLVQSSGLLLGTGRAAMEALSCSVPVLPLNQKFMGRFVCRQNYEFYEMNNFVAVSHEAPDPIKLCDLLREYLNNPGYWQQEAKILRGFIGSNLSIGKISGDIYNLYKQVYKENETR
jgi:glycosyltransferase involved in cell wall biosynthesis